LKKPAQQSGAEDEGLAAGAAPDPVVNHFPRMQGSMIRKSGNRFSERIMLKTKKSMIRKSGNRFSGTIMLKTKKDHDPRSDHDRAPRPSIAGSVASNPQKLLARVVS